MNVSYEMIHKFTGKSVFEKAVNSLIGLIQGISIDSEINEHEIQFIETWINDHKIRAHQHPFNEILPVLQTAIADGILSTDEKEDILWLCEKLTATDYIDHVTADMQKLHAILAAIAADGKITTAELEGLSAWLNEHEHLKSLWPYDEVESLILSVMKDKVIDKKEHQILLDFFSEFIAILDKRTIVNPSTSGNNLITGICAVCPEIVFEKSVFCLTGASSRYSRKDFESLIEAAGGTTSRGLTQKVNYLVIGSNGNPNWIYACYGRKVEQAINLRKQGHKVVITHENDFYDALEDKK